MSFCFFLIVFCLRCLNIFGFMLLCCLKMFHMPLPYMVFFLKSVAVVNLFLKQAL